MWHFIQSQMGGILITATSFALVYAGKAIWYDLKAWLEDEPYDPY